MIEVGVAVEAVVVRLLFRRPEPLQRISSTEPLGCRALQIDAVAERKRVGHARLGTNVSIVDDTITVVVLPVAPLGRIGNTRPTLGRLAVRASDVVLLQVARHRVRHVGGQVCDRVGGR